MSSSSLAVDLDTTVTTSAAAVAVAAVAATTSQTPDSNVRVPVANPVPGTGFSAFAKAASVSVHHAAPAAPIPVVSPPRPVLASAVPVPAAGGGFSSFMPKIFPVEAATAVAAAASLPGKLGSVVEKYIGSETRDDEHECLATAVYYESKGEPLEGQLAVAQVVLNRVQSGRYASSVCGVVKQPAQFSFVRRGRLPQAPKSSPAWQRSVAVAAAALDKAADSVAKNALSFHATYVAPAWRRNLTRIARIGAHIFYR